jgi:hypothetical protein
MVRSKRSRRQADSTLNIPELRRSVSEQIQVNLQRVTPDFLTDWHAKT